MTTKKKKFPPMKALMRINGVIEPGTIFYPDTQDDYDALVKCEAIAELSEAELILAERTTIFTLSELTGNPATMARA